MKKQTKRDLVVRAYEWAKGVIVERNGSRYYYCDDLTGRWIPVTYGTMLGIYNIVTSDYLPSDVFYAYRSEITNYRENRRIYDANVIKEFWDVFYDVCYKNIQE